MFFLFLESYLSHRVLCNFFERIFAWEIDFTNLTQWKIPMLFENRVGKNSIYYLIFSYFCNKASRHNDH